MPVKLTEDAWKELLRLKLRELIREQSEGEWSDEMIDADAAKFTEALAPLIAPPTPGEEGGEG